MDRKQMATAAAICGVVAFIAVLMPWYSMSVEVNTGSIPTELRGLEGMSGLQGTGNSQSFNGTEGDFNGVVVMIFAALAAVAAGLVVMRKTDVLPLDERQHLFAAVVLFAIAAIISMTDVFRGDLPGVSESAGMMKVEAGKSLGIYLTLIACLAGGVTAFLASQKPGAKDTKTPPPTDA